MNSRKIRFGSAILFGMLAVIFIRGVSGDEASPADVIDLNNTICPVMGGEVMEGQYVDWEGYRVHFCCGGCDARFLAEPEKYLPILAEDDAVAELLGIECSSCYPEPCVCEQSTTPRCGGCP